ncbi:unnamed protein product (macronuclear) [Paramecium tetraurelia]|uniref:Major facilitator superfamily (MFS) profile domain-containing protein n=1 Tax=Paramecium tetraurelia TaxID=5888 RepID=A0DCT4_PARTE|nr:uncharacterized protein GSPATT00015710001 [Paramecium tetraurelia]CAK80851.1 unnamed protein product [Paramecium tetraurelia]|eukprot:XP_001448248.1 hypothetical protein (macronuclear) [Paramecium tetraurelia strain d4-2]
MSSDQQGDQKPLMQPFSVLEPEDKKASAYDSSKYEGKCVDPRLMTFCITNFVINVGISQIAPFYPGLAADKAGLTYSQIGLVFSINPLGSILFSFVIGSFIQVWGRKKCLMIALVVQSSVQILFGCLNFMTDNKALFFSMSLISRFFQGMSRSVYSTVTFAYVPIFWPGEFQKKLAIMETMTALGLLFGPMIGSVLNYAFGYSIPFFVIAIFFLCAEVPTYTQLPPDSTMKSFEKKKKLPIGKAFTSIKVIVTIMNVMSITAGYTYFNPFFVNHMQSFGLSENVAAFILTIPAIFYIGMVNIIPKIGKYVKKTFMMSLALVICFSGNMLEAPFWGEGNTLASVIIGLILVGVSQSFSMIPSIPQISEFLAPVVTDPQFKNNLTDMASALFIMSMGCGSLVGPLLGGSVYDGFGGNVNLTGSPPQELIDQEREAFRGAMICLGLWQLTAATLFFFFGDGYKGWSDCCRTCSTGQQLPSDEGQQLTKPLNDDTSDDVMSDNDTLSSEASVGNDNDLLQGPPKKTITIRKEAL